MPIRQAWERHGCRMKRLYLVPDGNDIERSVGLAEEYGCAFEFNDFYVPAILDDVREQEKIIESYARYRSDFSGDTMHGAFLDVTIHSSDPLIREASIRRIHQSMRIAKRMGLRGVVFHTGRLSGFRVESYLMQWVDRNFAFFTGLAEEFPDQQIYMENMFDEAPDIMAVLAERMKGTGNFGICLDYAHAALYERPQREWVETLAPYIRHIHVNDNDLTNDLHRPVGTGKINWDAFDVLMRTNKIDASVLIEVKGYEEQKQSLEYMKRRGLYPYR